MKNKKGFTIVELVIVIAVIAILAGVLIPTFSGVVEKANKSAAAQNARNEYSLFMADAVEKGTSLQKGYIEVVKGNKTYWFAIEDGSLNTTPLTAKPEAAKLANDKLDLSCMEVKSTVIAVRQEKLYTEVKTGTLGADDATYINGYKADLKTLVAAGTYSADVQFYSDAKCATKATKDKYTQDEADAFNATLTGAVKKDDVKTAAVLYTYDEYKALEGNGGITTDQFAALADADKTKTAAVLYTAEEAKAYNANLTDAVDTDDDNMYAVKTYYYVIKLTELGNKDVHIYAAN